MVSTNRSDWSFNRKGEIFVEKLSKSGTLVIFPAKGELPEGPELENLDGLKCLVDRGRSRARVTLSSTIFDADLRIPGELARFLDAALMQDSVAANLIQPYLQLVNGTAIDPDVRLSPAQVLADSDFFYLYLGSLERHSQARAQDLANNIYHPLVWAVIYFYEGYVFSAKPAAALSAHARLKTQSQEIGKRHVEILTRCHTAPQPTCPSPDPLALSYYAFYVLGSDSSPLAADATLSAPTPTTSSMLGFLSKAASLRVTATASAPPSEPSVSVPTASSSAEASGSAPLKAASLSLKRGLKSLWSGTKWKSTDREVEGDEGASRAKRARKVTGEP
ncbi:hypothetical protein K525DRAFT_273692 [Schizophyllum commune Loenen D]|nr:hypothetical protein K525DRAFT_273692 [Schizophyllum commune Loenen D]